MHGISSRTRVKCSAYGAPVAGLLLSAVMLLGSPYAVAQSYASRRSAVVISKSERLDVRQSPYYKGYDYYAGRADQGAYGDGQIHPWHVQGNVWLMAGEPGESNVAVQIGNNGALVVDTGTKEMAPKLLAVIQKISDEYGGDQKRIRWVVNTDELMDHIGGNYVIRNGGKTIVGSNFAFDNPGLTPGATVIGSLNSLTRMVIPNAKGQPAVAQGLWPNETHTEPLYSWDFNDEAVRLYHPASANTDGNEMVMFRRSDVLATGDVLNMVHYPIIDAKRGGSIDGELAALNQAMDLAVADFHMGPQEGGTMIIPGHGRLCDQGDLVEYTIIITTIRNRIMYYKNQGKSLKQVLALKPTWDFDDRWGESTGSWNSQQFVQEVYETLPAKGKAKDKFAMPAMASG